MYTLEDGDECYWDNSNCDKYLGIISGLTNSRCLAETEVLPAFPPQAQQEFGG